MDDRAYYESQRLVWTQELRNARKDVVRLIEQSADAKWWEGYCLEELECARNNLRALRTRNLGERFGQLVRAA